METVGVKQKAWVVSYDVDAYSVVVYAATRNQARSAGASELEREYLDVTVRRAKEWDDRPPTILNLLAAGWSWECAGCYKRLCEEDVPIVEPFEIYCSYACREKAMERDARIAGFNAGATFRNRELAAQDLAEIAALGATLSVGDK